MPVTISYDLRVNDPNQRTYVRSMLDHSDPAAPYGNQPFAGRDLPLVAPTNQQSSEATLRAFVDTATQAT